MELIDRKVLKAKLEKIADMNNPKWSYDSMMIAKIMIEILNEAPTVEERNRGHWEGGGAYYCSNCNAYAATDVFGGGLDIAEQHYCYNCGAKMEEKKEGISND